MSKRLITATAVFAFGALAFGALATTADARPHRYVDQSYSDDDDDDDRPVQRYRRQAHKPADQEGSEQARAATAGKSSRNSNSWRWQSRSSSHTAAAATVRRAPATTSRETPASRRTSRCGAVRHRDARSPEPHATA
jgi:hypothetical protein